MPLVYRGQKAAPLSYDEVDTNFQEALRRANHEGDFQPINVLAASATALTARRNGSGGKIIDAQLNNASRWYVDHLQMFLNSPIAPVKTSSQCVVSLTNGIIAQFGKIAVSAPQPNEFAFPEPFPTAAVAIFASYAGSSARISNAVIQSNTTFRIYTYQIDVGDELNGSGSANWLALGY